MTCEVARNDDRLERAGARAIYVSVKAEEIREYVTRPWELIAREKVRTRAERYARTGPEGALAGARNLREQWLRLHPEGFSTERRKTDFEAHVQLKKKLSLIADALRRS